MSWVLIIAAAISISDQLTKYLVVRCIGREESRVIVADFFSIVNWRNTGAAWGIFQDQSLVLAGISFSCCICSVIPSSSNRKTAAWPSV